LAENSEMTHGADLWSVRELMEQLRGDEAWTLAVAQRAFEWDRMRVTNLVDSILRGFPIGSLLVAKHDGPTYDIQDQRKFRDLNTDKGETTQILDGQQRCKAILASFGGDGLPSMKTGRQQHLWINLMAPNPRYQEFSREHGTLWLMRWLDKGLHPNKMNVKERRAEKMNLRGGEPHSGWIQFKELVNLAQKNSRPRTIATKAGATLATDGVESCIRQLKERVRRAVDRQNIPVHVLQPPQTGAAVADLHQVFVRLNVGGKPLSAADEFFAGAKRYWPQAEAGIRPLIQVLSPLKRQGVITLLTRVAARTMTSKPADPYPLRLEVLAKTAVNDKNNPLVARMQELSEDKEDQSLAIAMRWVSDLCFHHMSCGLHGIGDTPWMAAVGWAFAWLQKRPLPSIEDSQYAGPLCGFLFWASLLQSQTYGRGGFARRAFSQCWENGRSNQPVPYADPEFKKVCFNYEYVQKVLPQVGHLNSNTLPEDREKIYTLMRRNRWLFLGPFQGVGRGRGWTEQTKKQPGMEWEHIVPFNKARGLFKQSRSYLTRYTSQIGSIANFAAIDGRSNRVFNDCSIGQKVGWAKDTTHETYADFRFVRARVKLTDAEIELLKVVDEQLETGRNKVVAGEALLKFLELRSGRIWRYAVDMAGPPPQPNEEYKGIPKRD
jgi:hypothetical protein